MFDCNGLFGSTAGEVAFMAKQNKQKFKVRQPQKHLKAKQGILAARVDFVLRSCTYFVVGCRKFFMGGRRSGRPSKRTVQP